MQFMGRDWYLRMGSTKGSTLCVEPPKLADGRFQGERFILNPTNSQELGTEVQAGGSCLSLLGLYSWEPFSGGKCLSCFLQEWWWHTPNFIQNGLWVGWGRNFLFGQWLEHSPGMWETLCLVRRRGLSIGFPPLRWVPCQDHLAVELHTLWLNAYLTITLFIHVQ